MREQIDPDIIMCDRATAKEIWNKEPELRHKLWLDTEVDDALLLGPEEIDKIKEKKKGKGGFIYRKGVSLDN